MKIQSFVVGPVQENTYLVIDETTQHAVLIDPGEEPERLIAAIRTAGVTLDAIWLTHAHFDHIGAIAGVRRAFPVPVHMHPLDLPLYERAEEQAASFGLEIEQPDIPEFNLAEGDVLRLGALEFDVLHTPGHAPGHVVFRHGTTLFGGDLLFAGSIGRIDLPLANAAHMEESLTRIAQLDPAIVVHPGHGTRTTIGHERATNGFLDGTIRLVKG